MRHHWVRPVLLICATALSATCTSESTEPSAPFARGTITSRQARVYHVQSSTGVRIDSVPQMLVEEEPGSMQCERNAWFGLDARTRVLDGATHADTSALTLGRRVSVWAEGVVLESCPPITYAAEVRLEAP